MYRIGQAEIKQTTAAIRQRRNLSAMDRVGSATALNGVGRATWA